jgi:hypothetical protein
MWLLNVLGQIATVWEIIKNIYLYYRRQGIFIMDEEIFIFDIKCSGSICPVDIKRA